jgi:hypothetical protein
MTRAIAAIREVQRHMYSGRDMFPVDETDKELGDRLYKLNASAVAQRYREEAETVKYDDELFLSFSKINMLKALQCLNYQCSEGDIPDTPIYKALNDIEHSLASIIIHDLKEYDDAPWDSRDDEPALLRIG